MPLHFPSHIFIKINQANPHAGIRARHSTKVLHTCLVFSILVMGCSQQKSPITNPVTPVEPTATQTALPVKFSGDGNLIFLSMEENGYAHLFAYNPRDLPLTRITAGNWNDTSPSLSPDRTQLAFASNRNGHWDLYIMSLKDGSISQVTNSPEYDSSPSWSPDGLWLVFETYLNDNLELAVISRTDPSQKVIPLTQDPASDHSPVWAPDGRHVAFVSSRGGESDIWLANLDVTGNDRYKDLSNTPNASESHPIWNYDGSQLLWSSTSQADGFSGLYIWNAKDPERSARWIGDGSWGAWNETGNKIISITSGPNQQYMTSYDIKGNLLIPPLPLQGRVRGLTWGLADLPDPIPDAFKQAAAITPSALWAPVITPVGDIPKNRWYLVPLANLQAPYPQMHDLVDESFRALRARAVKETGWDPLASLENAFVPLTTSLQPGMQEDWLYTGRAFAINSLMSNAGWMITIREDVGAQTYWRLYIRCTLQDGSLGEPIHDAPWNLNARYDLNPRTYEQGGAYAPVPAGYWVDMTALAAAYNWERLPSLPNWRNYYTGTRFSEFALTGGLDWYSAMLELYPPESLITPTRVLAPSLTPTITDTPTPTERPTRTPRPTGSPTGSPTASVPPTTTFTPTLTPTPPTIIP
jgi:TolB protein